MEDGGMEDGDRKKRRMETGSKGDKGEWRNGRREELKKGRGHKGEGRQRRREKGRCASDLIIKCIIAIYERSIILV